ncbi:MAG: polysaccharide pyruvyl transferase family protein [Candidatus Lokiarchaeia archaeon]
MNIINIIKLLSIFSQLDIIISCKYHSIIFSYLLSKPMLVINYYPKNAALLQEIMLTKKGHCLNRGYNESRE